MRTLLWIGMLAALGCEPSVHGRAAIRRTLSDHVAADPPESVRENARAARAALAKWKPARVAAPLLQAVDEAERRIALAAESGSQDAQLRRAVDEFSTATARLVAADRPLDDDALGDVQALLARSRSDAMAARAREPTAASPSNALKVLRAHQAGEGAPDAAGAIRP